MSRALTVVGLMSGTSQDGIDAAIVCTDGLHVLSMGPAASLPYPTAFRARLADLVRRAVKMGASLSRTDPEVVSVEAELTDLHIQAVRELMVKAGGSVKPGLLLLLLLINKQRHRHHHETQSTLTHSPSPHHS